MNKAVAVLGKRGEAKEGANEDRYLYTMTPLGDSAPVFS